MSEDESHLHFLVIAHYVLGGISILFACFPLIHAFVGLSILSGVDGMHDALQNSTDGSPPSWFGWLFFLMGLLFFLIGQTVSVSLILSGRYLKQRKHYMFSFVLACIACAFFPFGTVLGVFTILVLSRASVKELYGRP